ncbi:hypothetical protein [Acinetobacter sp. TUM15051]|uniref:hypothetical protein n=1 Tax=Acinetobacter sp. TUM15051 TaxID=2609132 RepID=UPI00124E0DD8|nr:hypothetical protein [Acinetobacter sp. TUM15051]
MSEFKAPKIGDKIVIPEGFILVGFNGDYKKVYEVADFFFDKKHNMHFITFEADGKQYTFTSCAFDKASTAEISAGFREGTEEFDNYWYGRSEAEEIAADHRIDKPIVKSRFSVTSEQAKRIGDRQIERYMKEAETLGDDSHIENHISSLCKSKDV